MSATKKPWSKLALSWKNLVNNLNKDPIQDELNELKEKDRITSVTHTPPRWMNKYSRHNKSYEKRNRPNPHTYQM